jgi:hypothetical protein
MSINKKISVVCVVDWVGIFLCVISCILLRIGSSSMIEQIKYDEQVFKRQIYPNIMKEPIVISTINGLIVSGYFSVFLCLFSKRIYQIKLGALLLISIPILYILFYVTAIFNERNGFLDVNYYLLLLYLFLFAVILVANFVYIGCSAMDRLHIKSFFTWPNYYCSFVMILMFFYAWYLALMFVHITI